MDLDRPHFRTTSIGGSSSATAAATTTTSELFICFTSRLSSSSSMKLTKSILSPGRAARDGGGAASLSASLSRRLRTNGSLKGGASPFFTTTGKKRGCGFENPEPSSPKVTCIGQVRVKTKKKVKQSRSLSRRRSGEVSFRKIEQAQGEREEKSCAQRYSNGSAHYQQQPECLPHRNQRWVHLPISICEALRAFGAEFSCLFPCKSSCFSTSEREKGEKQNGSCGSDNGCGAVFARWLVSVNDGESGKRREIELVVGGGDEVEEKRMSMRSSRRHVFEDIEVKDDKIEVKGQNHGEGEEEAARVSICIPPKNALLLMRCRSDPMKMADLASRFSWDAQAAAASVASAYNNETGIIEEVTSGGGGDEIFEDFACEGKDEIFMVKEAEGLGGVLEQDVAVAVDTNEEPEISVEKPEVSLETEVEENGQGEEIDEEELGTGSEEKLEDKEGDELGKEIEVNEEALVDGGEEEEEEVESNMSSFEDLLNRENADQHYEDCPIQDKEQIEDSPIRHLSPSTTESEISEEEEDTTESSTEVPLLPDETPFEKEEEEETSAEQNQVKPEPQTTILQKCRIEGEEKTKPLTENQELVSISAEPKKDKENKVLPDCLLLMMCEPKLSMEVSKETWVCSTDFIRWLPQRPPKQPPKPTKSGGGDNPPAVKRRLSTDSKPKNIDNVNEQPPRSSCSLPAAAAVLEQKLVNAAAYEPFVLTRCKSEPMRTAAAKLMPESCVWKNAVRKMEPHRRATVGVGPV